MRWMIGLLMATIITSPVFALSLDDLSNKDAVGGLKAALIQAADTAVAELGAENGFFDNAKVKIPLPDTLKKAEKAMRMFGMGDEADELVLRMNRAAEAAVPEAKVLLIDAVKKMSVQDAKDILTGGDDAATRYFKKTTAGPMAEKFLPIVKKATENVQLAQQYNQFAEAGARFGLVKKDQASLEQYVTQKTLDGVYTMMAEEEKAIRTSARIPWGRPAALSRRCSALLINKRACHD